MYGSISILSLKLFEFSVKDLKKLGSLDTNDPTRVKPHRFRSGKLVEFVQNLNPKMFQQRLPCPYFPPSQSYFTTSMSQTKSEIATVDPHPILLLTRTRWVHRVLSCILARKLLGTFLEDRREIFLHQVQSSKMRSLRARAYSFVTEYAVRLFIGHFPTRTVNSSQR